MRLLVDIPTRRASIVPDATTDGRVLAARPKLEERVIDLVFGATPSQRDRHHAEILVYLVGDIAEEGEGGARHLPQHLLPGDVRLRARAQRGEGIQRVRARFLRASWLAIPTSAQCREQLLVPPDEGCGGTSPARGDRVFGGRDSSTFSDRLPRTFSTSERRRCAVGSVSVERASCEGRHCGSAFPSTGCTID